MKKTISFLFALLLLLSCFEVASADNNVINADIPCVSEYDTPKLVADWTPTDEHQGGIYIYHNVKTKVKKKHNNLFFVGDSIEYTNPYLEKWCTPGVNRKYNCSAICSGNNVSARARGNTFYHDDNSSLRTIHINGSIGWKK